MTDKRRSTALNEDFEPPKDWGLTSISERYAQFEKLRQEGEISTQFIALEAFCSIVGAIREGYSEDEIINACPDAWGTEDEQTVRVPIALLQALAWAWDDYKNADAGITLGEAFGVEGGGQGKQPAKKQQATRDRRRKLAAAVEVEYRAWEKIGRPITQAEAIEFVSENQRVKLSTVEAAFNEYKQEVRDAGLRHGLIKKEG